MARSTPGRPARPGVDPQRLGPAAHSDHFYALYLLATTTGFRRGERLGHASPEFTARVYQHVLPAMDQDAANSIAALMVDPDEGPDAAEDGSHEHPR